MHFKDSMHQLGPNFNASLRIFKYAVGEYATKLGDSARKRSVKKQPFNALQNVMHKQAFATPFKGVKIQNTAKLHSNVQCSQPRKKFGQHLTPTTKPQTSLSRAQTSEMDLLLDSFDIDRPCCKEPYKSKYNVIPFELTHLPHPIKSR